MRYRHRCIEASIVKDEHVRAPAVHSENAQHLQFELAAIQRQIRQLRDVEQHLADALIEWDRSPHAVPIHELINSLIDRSPTA